MSREAGVASGIRKDKGEGGAECVDWCGVVVEEVSGWWLLPGQG